MALRLPPGVTVDDVLDELRMRDTIAASENDDDLRDYLGSRDRLSNPELRDLPTHELHKLVHVALIGSEAPIFRDVRDVCDPAVKRAASTVCAIVHRDGIKRIEDGERSGWQLALKTLAEVERFCDDEPLARNLVAVGLKCTGFLVGKRMVATAGHAPLYPECADQYRCVFDFVIGDGEADAGSFYTDNQVFSVTGITREHDLDRCVDWALLNLDRDVDREPCRRRDDVKIGDHIYVLGHPWCLPMKYASGCITRDWPNFFYTTAVTYKYNSGSPVMLGDCVTAIHSGNVFDSGHDGCGRWVSCDAFSVPPLRGQLDDSMEFRLAVIADRVCGPVTIESEKPAYVRTRSDDDPVRVDSEHPFSFEAGRTTVVWLLSHCLERNPASRWIPYTVQPGQKWLIRSRCASNTPGCVEMIYQSNQGGES